MKARVSKTKRIRVNRIDLLDDIIGDEALIYRDARNEIRDLNESNFFTMDSKLQMTRTDIIEDGKIKSIGVDEDFIFYQVGDCLYVAKPEEGEQIQMYNNVECYALNGERQCIVKSGKLSKVLIREKLVDDGFSFDQRFKMKEVITKTAITASGEIYFITDEYHLYTIMSERKVSLVTRLKHVPIIDVKADVNIVLLDTNGLVYLHNNGYFITPAVCKDKYIVCIDTCCDMYGFIDEIGCAYCFGSRFGDGMSFVPNDEGDKFLQIAFNNDNVALLTMKNILYLLNDNNEFTTIKSFNSPIIFLSGCSEKFAFCIGEKYEDEYDIEETDEAQLRRKHNGLCITHKPIDCDHALRVFRSIEAINASFQTNQPLVTERKISFDTQRVMEIYEMFDDNCIDSIKHALSEFSFDAIFDPLQMRFLFILLLCTKVPISDPLWMKLVDLFIVFKNKYDPDVLLSDLDEKAFEIIFSNLNNLLKSYIISNGLYFHYNIKIAEVLKVFHNSVNREYVRDYKKFYNDTLNEYIDPIRDYNNTQLSYIRETPFLVSLDNKKKLIYKRDKSSFFVINIDRDHIIESTVKQCSSIQDPGKTKGDLKVVFKEEECTSINELKTKYFNPFINSIIDAEYFINIKDFYWFNHKKNDPATYKAIGMILGLCIYNNCKLDITFPSAFFKKFIGIQLTFEDLNEFDEELSKSLKKLYDYNESEIRDLGLVFAFNGINLIPDGSDIDVDTENKEQYITKVMDHIMKDRIENSFNNLVEGFILTSGISDFNMLCPEELKELLINQSL